jgi:hypothetical protein
MLRGIFADIHTSLACSSRPERLFDISFDILFWFKSLVLAFWISLFGIHVFHSSCCDSRQYYHSILALRNRFRARAEASGGFVARSSVLRNVIGDLGEDIVGYL